MRIKYYLLLVYLIVSGCGTYYIPEYYIEKTSSRSNIYFTCEKDGFYFEYYFPTHGYAELYPNFYTCYDSCFVFEACTTDIIIKKLDCKILYNTEDGIQEAETLKIKYYLSSNKNEIAYKTIEIKEIEELLPLQLFKTDKKKMNRKSIRIWFTHRILPKIKGEITFDSMGEIFEIDGEIVHGIPLEKGIKKIKVYYNVEIQTENEIKYIKDQIDLSLGFDKRYVNELW